MSEACHTAPHHRMIKTPFGKLSHCAREGPLLRNEGRGEMGLAGGACAGRALEEEEKKESWKQG